MQRRAAAAYFVFFLVLGAGAYSFIAFAEEPAIDLQGQTYSQGDTVNAGGTQYRVAELKAEQSSGGGGGHGGGGGDSGGPTYSGTLEPMNGSNQTISLSEGSNVTLGGQQYVVHFKSGNEVVLSQDYPGYQRGLEKQAAFKQRMNGFWGVVILSGIANILLIGLAYMPTRG